MRSGGPEGLKALKALKLRPSRSDYGPPLRWEWPVWQWFHRLAACPPLGGPPQVDGVAWLALCDRLGWDVDLSFGLIGVIEDAYRPEEPK